MLICLQLLQSGISILLERNKVNTLALHETPLFSLDAPENQNYLINFLLSLGYNVTREGVCFGFSEKISEAFLSGNLILFLQRLALMQYRVNVYKNAINYVEDFEEKHRKAKAENHFDEANKIEQELDDIRTFSADLAMCQSPQYYPYILGGYYLGQLQKAARQSSTTVESNYFAIVQTSSSFVTLLERIQAKTSHALSIILILNNHAITLHYQPNTHHAFEQVGQWIVIDPNALYSLEFTDDLKSIAETILNKNEPMAFGLSVKMNMQYKADVEKIEACLSDVQVDVIAPSAKLLEMACLLGNLDLVKRLVDRSQAMSPPSLRPDEILRHGITNAALNNHVVLVQYLLTQAGDTEKNSKQACIHTALGVALEKGSKEVLQYLLETYSELLLWQNNANQTLVMLSASNHISLSLVLEHLSKQPKAEVTRILSMKDATNNDTLFYARSNHESLSLVLDLYSHDRKLQEPLRDIQYLQKLLLVLMSHPKSLSVFVNRIHQNSKLRSYLKTAIFDTVSSSLVSHPDAQQYHLILIACRQYPEALKILLSCLPEDDLINLLSENIDELFDANDIDSHDGTGHNFFDKSKLLPIISSMTSSVSAIPFIGIIYLLYPRRLEAVLNRLSESGIEEVLFLEGNVANIMLASFGAIQASLPQAAQDAIEEARKVITNKFSSALYVELLRPEFKMSLSQLVYNRIHSPEILESLQARISWLQMPEVTSSQEDDHVEIFKTLLPEHQAIRNWFNALDSSDRVQILTSCGNLLTHAPHLFECILSDCTPSESTLFMNKIIVNPTQYLSKRADSRMNQMLLAKLTSEEINLMFKDMLSEDLAGIVTFFTIENDVILMFWARLDERQQFALLTQRMPHSDQTTIQVLLGDVRGSSWCRKFIDLIPELLKSLASETISILLMSTPAIFRLPRINPSTYLAILDLLKPRDQMSLINYRFPDGEQMTSSDAYCLLRMILPTVKIENEAVLALWWKLDDFTQNNTLIDIAPQAGFDITKNTMRTLLEQLNAIQKYAVLTRFISYSEQRVFQEHLDADTSLWLPTWINLLPDLLNESSPSNLCELIFSTPVFYRLCCCSESSASKSVLALIEAHHARYKYTSKAERFLKIILSSYNAEEIISLLTVEKDLLLVAWKKLNRDEEGSILLLPTALGGSICDALVDTSKPSWSSDFIPLFLELLEPLDAYQKHRVLMDTPNFQHFCCSEPSTYEAILTSLSYHRAKVEKCYSVSVNVPNPQRLFSNITEKQTAQKEQLPRKPHGPL